MPPPWRKAMLTVHVTSSVGWLGAVAASLVLAILGLQSHETHLMRAAYLALDALGWSVLVPLSLASLLSGLVQSLGTTWGLIRHYWVMFKLLINLVATTVLLLYTRTLTTFADAAADPGTDQLLQLPRASPVLHAGAGLVLLLIAVGLSVYKPRGVTPYGYRRQARPTAQRR